MAFWRSLGGADRDRLWNTRRCFYRHRGYTRQVLPSQYECIFDIPAVSLMPGLACLETCPARLILVLGSELGIRPKSRKEFFSSPIPPA